MKELKSPLSQYSITIFSFPLSRKESKYFTTYQQLTPAKILHSLSFSICCYPKFIVPAPSSSENFSMFNCLSTKTPPHSIMNSTLTFSPYFMSNSKRSFTHFLKNLEVIKTRGAHLFSCGNSCCGNSVFTKAICTHANSIKHFKFII